VKSDFPKLTWTIPVLSALYSNLPFEPVVSVVVTVTVDFGRH
jgi:hypothetical protein